MPDLGLNFGAATGISMSPHEKLKEFIRDTEKLLDSFVREGRDPQGRRLISPDLLISLRRAWEEVRPQFRSVEAAIDNLSTTKMTTHGLSGVQADLKAGLCQRFYRRFVEFGGRKFFKMLLDAIDNFLGSILKALGVENAIEEFKHVIEQSVDDDYPGEGNA